MPDNELHESLRGGQMWSRVLRRGQILSLIDLEGGATPAALFFNASQPLERYNFADTLKAQHTAKLTRGHVLYSDMGRVLCSIIEDSAGWHDTLTGHMDRAAAQAKLGEGSFQKLRNDYYRDTRSNFLIELGKHGLGKRGIVPNVNFFAKITPDQDGRLSWQPIREAGCKVSLRAEMDVLVVLSNTPHPLDPATRYAPKPVALSIRQGPRTVPLDDLCRNSCEQNRRGFQLTEDFNLGT